jgi:hypothetical protein
MLVREELKARLGVRDPLDHQGCLALRDKLVLLVPPVSQGKEDFKVYLDLLALKDLEVCQDL